MADLSPPWGNATDGKHNSAVEVHTKAKPFTTIATVPASTGASKMPISRLLMAAPDLYTAAKAVLERHAKPFGGGTCPCDDCADLLEAVARADGEIG